MVSLPREPLASSTRLWIDLCLHPSHGGAYPFLISPLFSEIEVGPCLFSEWSHKAKQSQAAPEEGRRFTVGPEDIKPMRAFGSEARRCGGKA